MSGARNYLAIDLGAESGRTVLGVLDGGQLTLQETYRFRNGPVRLPEGLQWDVSFAVRLVAQTLIHLLAIKCALRSECIISYLIFPSQ
jgi:sugar (pentulose or hexulose) kinase